MSTRMQAVWDLGTGGQGGENTAQAIRVDSFSGSDIVLRFWESGNFFPGQTLQLTSYMTSGKFLHDLSPSFLIYKIKRIHILRL